MFGFKKGLYSNSVAWFFSALLIVVFLIDPWIVKYKKAYIFYAAPLITFFSYDAISVLYDYMYAPDYIIPNTVIHKGIIRALAGINAGAFAYGLSNELKSKIIRKYNIFFTIAIILFLIVFAYVIIPFDSNTQEISLQID